MTVTPITSLDEFKRLIASGKVIFIDFWATWCGPCKQISPIFEKLSEEHARDGAVEFYKVDVDAVPDVAQEARIRAMPTFHVYKDNQRIDEVVGAIPPQLTALINKGVALV